MTLDELRQKYPDLYQGKNDAEMVYTLSQVTGASPVRVAYDMGLDPSGFAQNEGTMDDLGTSLELGYEQTKRGLANLPNLPYALATGENLYETPEMDNEVARIQGTFSPGYQAAQREIGSAWDEGRYGDYALGLITNPGYTGNQLMQFGAPMVAGGIVGAGIRGASWLGALGNGMLARGAATAAPYIGEAVPSAAIQYKDLLDKDVDPRTAALTGLATGVGVGAAAGLGGYLAGKAGYMDPEKFLSGMTRKVGDDTVPLSYKGQIGYGMLAEGAEEAVQSPWEEAMANVAQDKPWDEGLGRAAIEGGIAGGIIGGGFNALAPPLRRITPDQPTDLLQDGQQATPVPPGVNPPGDRTPHIDPLAAERQRQIDALMGGETSQTIRPGQADPGSLQGLTRDQINQRLIDAAMGGETARTFAPGQYPSDVAADLSQQQARLNAVKAAEQAKKAREQAIKVMYNGVPPVAEAEELLKTPGVPTLEGKGKTYTKGAVKYANTLAGLDAKGLDAEGEALKANTTIKAEELTWKRELIGARRAQLAKAQTLAQQANQNAAIDGPGVPVTPTVAQNAQPVEGAVPPAPTTSSVAQDEIDEDFDREMPPITPTQYDRAKANGIRSTSDLDIAHRTGELDVPTPPPSPTTPETPTNALSGQTTPQAGQETGTTPPDALAPAELTPLTPPVAEGGQALVPVAGTALAETTDSTEVLRGAVRQAVASDPGLSKKIRGMTASRPEKAEQLVDAIGGFLLRQFGVGENVSGKVKGQSGGDSRTFAQELIDTGVLPRVSHAWVNERLNELLPALAQIPELRTALESFTGRGREFAESELDTGQNNLVANYGDNDAALVASLNDNREVGGLDKGDLGMEGTEKKVSPNALAAWAELSNRDDGTPDPEIPAFGRLSEDQRAEWTAVADAFKDAGLPFATLRPQFRKLVYGLQPSSNEVAAQNQVANIVAAPKIVKEIKRANAKARKNDTDSEPGTGPGTGPDYGGGQPLPVVGQPAQGSPPAPGTQVPRASGNRGRAVPPTGSGRTLDAGGNLLDPVQLAAERLSIPRLPEGRTSDNAPTPMHIKAWRQAAQQDPLAEVSNVSEETAAEELKQVSAALATQGLDAISAWKDPRNATQGRVALRRALMDRANAAVETPKTQVQQGLGEDVAATNPTTEQALRDTIASLLGKGHNWRIHVYATPEEAHAAGHTPRKVGNAYGWVEADQKGVKHTYFIVDRIEKGTELGKFLHEVGAHIGLENILSPALYNNLVSQLRKWAAQNDNSLESKLAKAALERVKNAQRESTRAGREGLDQAAQDSELVAYFLEEAVKAGVDPTATRANSPLGTWFVRLWAAFKRALRKLRVENLDQLTPQHVVDLAYGAAHMEMQRGSAAESLPIAINVDGVDRPTQNSEGKPIHPTEEGVRNFWKWFGDSKVVDDQGRPLVVYHWTRNADEVDKKGFAVFDKNKIGSFATQIGEGFYFAPRGSAYDQNTSGLDTALADDTADGINNGLFAYPVYLKLDKPFVLGINNVAAAKATTGKILTKLAGMTRDGKQPYAYVKEQLNEYGDDPALYYEENVPTGDYGNTADFTNAAKSLNFDGGISYAYDGGIDQLVVWEPTQIKSAIGNQGTFDPSNPNISYGIAAPSHITPIKEAVHNALSDTYTGSSRGLLGWMGINHMAERFGDTLPILKSIEKTFNEMSHQAKQWLDRGDQIERIWSMLTPKQMELVSFIGGNATLNQFDPSKDQANTPEKQEIAQKWKELQALDAANPKVKGTTTLLAAVQHYRDVHQESLDYLEDVLKQAQAAGASTHAIESVRDTVKALKKKQTHFWLPLHRFGDFHSVAMSPTLFALHQRREQHLEDVHANKANPAVWGKDDDKLFRKLRKDPKHYEVMGHDSERAASRRAAHWQGKGWNATSNKNRYTSDQARAHLKPEIEAFEKMLTHTKIDARVVGKLIDSYTDLLIESLPENHILKRQLDREGIAGWDPDMKRAFAKTAQSQAFAMSRLLHVRKLSEQLDQLRQEGSSFKPNATLARDLHDELIKQQDLAMTRSEDPYWVRFATGFNYMSMLGGSPFFWALQLAQVPTITLPYLIGRNNADITGTMRTLGRAWGQAKDFIKWGVEANEWRAELDFSRAVQGITPEELRALKDMDDAGRFVFTIGQDLGAAAEGRNTKTARFIRSINTPTHTTELINRVSTGLAAYRISRKNNNSEKQAIEFALRAIDNTQVNMDPVMGARNLKTLFGAKGTQPFAKIIFQFWKFQQGMAYTTLTTMKDALTHPDPKLKKQARDSAIGLTVSLMATSGLFGLPFVGTGMMLLSFLAGLDGDDDEDDNIERLVKNWIAEAPVPKIVADTLNKGFLSSVLPTDVAPHLAPRFSLGTLMNPLGFARFDDAERGEDVVKELMFRVLGGPTGSSAAAFWDGIQAGLDGEYAKATEKIVPLKLMRDLARAYTLADKGVSTGNGENRIDPDDMSVTSWVWQAMGVTPMKKAMYHEGQAGVQALKNAVTGEREKLLAKHAQARLKGEDVSAVTREILRFNQKHPHARIKAENLRQAHDRRRDNRRKLTETGILADKQNQPYLGNAAWTR